MEPLFRRLKTDFSPQKIQIRGLEIKICHPKTRFRPRFAPAQHAPALEPSAPQRRVQLGKSKVQAQDHPSLRHRA